MRIGMRALIYEEFDIILEVIRRKDISCSQGQFNINKSRSKRHNYSNRSIGSPATLAHTDAFTATISSTLSLLFLADDSFTIGMHPVRRSKSPEGRSDVDNPKALLPKISQTLKAVF